ncbi:hypothetical protein HDE_06564 [Halotydeus destructor]|nr:hypothetical protein HDE_06564 [Halotydeus destructor]
MPSSGRKPKTTSYKDHVSSVYASLLEERKFDKFFQFFGVAISNSAQRPSKIVRFVQFLIITLLSTTLVRHLFLFFMTDMSIPDRILYLGDVRLSSLQPTFAIVTTVFQLYCLLIILVFTLANHQDWPLKLRDLHYSIADLPLVYSDGSHILGIWRFRRRMVIEVTATLIFVAGSLIVMMMDVAIKHYGEYSVLAYLFWSIIFSIYTFVAACVALFSLIQFATSSKLITSALSVVNKNLELLAVKSKNECMTKEDNELFKRLCRTHESVIETIAECNGFWKKYLLVFYITLIPCMCFLLNNLIFSDIGFWPRLSLVDLAFCMIVIISYNSMVAAQVHDEAHACYGSVYRVVLHQENAEVRAEGSLWLQRLSGSPISFYFWDFVPMTKSVLTSLFSVTLTYLFFITSGNGRFSAY